jgi:arsenate reductase
MNDREHYKLKILFLCTGNSCRSQMAEGFARALKGDTIEPYSAGTEPKELDPRAVAVMNEIGIHISAHRSKHVNEFRDQEFDYVITLCGGAQETCPVFPGKTRVVHVGFDDPPALAKEATSDEEALECYRRVRDEIQAFIVRIPESIKEKANDFILP